MKKYLIIIISLLMCNNVYAYECMGNRCTLCEYKSGDEQLELYLDNDNSAGYLHIEYNGKKSISDNDISHLLELDEWYEDGKGKCLDNIQACYYPNFENATSLKIAKDCSIAMNGYEAKDFSFSKTDDVLFSNKDESKKAKKSRDKVENEKVSGCPLGPDVTKDISGILRVIKIIVPLLVVAFSTWDLIRAIASGDAQAGMKKQAVRFGKRLAAAIVLFFIPVLVNQLMILLNIWDEDGGCEITGDRVINTGETTTKKVCEMLSKESCNSRDDCTIYKENCVKKCSYYSIQECPTDRCQVTGPSSCSSK